MTECYQDLNIYFHKASKEARDDFFKYYLDNVDQFADYNSDLSNKECFKLESKSFKILDCKNYSTDHNSLGLIKPQFSFLYPAYHLTVMIDLSQSMLWTTSNGDVKLDKGLEIFKEILNRIITSKISCNPNVIINVFCFKSSKLFVIIKGWELKSDNYESFFKYIIKKIYKKITLENEKSNNVFFNIIREGIISSNLIENNNKIFSNLLIVTDANFPIPDGLFLDKIISILRFCSVSCSFIHIKSDNEIKKFSSITDQGNEEQLKFIVNVSGGFYVTSKDFGLLNKFIMSYQCFDQSECNDYDTITLKYFNEKSLSLPPLNLILSLINSGYYLNSVNVLRDSRCEIELQLPWKHDIYLRANIVFKYPIAQHRKCLFTLSICANTYFLYCISKVSTITELIDKNIQRFSSFLTIKRAYIYFMESFSQFNLKTYCTIPAFINYGLKPMFSPTNQPCDKIDKSHKGFFDFWKRTLDLEYLICLHTTKINILLEHDYPFPEFLSTRDPMNNKYSTIQCREALVQLNTLINKNFCSFIVKENNTYVKFFSSSTTNISEKNELNYPNHFCVIKLVVKDFEAKLLLYFFIYTPENIREEFVTNLINDVANLKFPPRGKQARPRHMSSQTTRKLLHVPPQQRSWEQINCCIVLNLDLENLVATYNPIISVDCNKQVIRQKTMSLSMIYLRNQCYHEHVVWCINSTFMKNIFETLIKVRLQEGFHFAGSDSESGFINLIKEIKLLNNNNNIYHCFIQYMIYFDQNRFRQDNENSNTFNDICDISDRYTTMMDTVKLITEILIERKDGTVTHSDPEVKHWDGLKYKDVSKEIINIDLKCLETFVTFECFQIYPATLPRSLVKPNICSVLQNSICILLNCPLYSGDSEDNFNSLNTIFFEILDRNLKLHGFSQIDITKTESKSYNKLLRNLNSNTYCTSEIFWHCYYVMKGEYLVVLMLPANYLNLEINMEKSESLPLFVYGMSIKHLSFLLEDPWTLKLPEYQEFKLPLTIDKKCLDFHLLNTINVDKRNEFGIEIENIQSFLMECVKKLDSIYILTFVAGVHRNLRENRELIYDNLSKVFSVYCNKLSVYDVDATRFMNTICSHCFYVLQSNTIQTTQLLSLINKENCETKTGMHDRIVKRIRVMMARYFKEVPSFPQILIYCPENEVDTLAEFNETIENEFISNLNEDHNFINYQRQLSQDHQLQDIELSGFIGDNISDLDTKSISSIAISNRSNCCPLFISINYTLKYGDKQKSVNFDNIPTCISDFIDEVKSITNGEINFEKLHFNLEMIPITVIDEDLNTECRKIKNENFSLLVGDGKSLRKNPSDITKKYLSTFQTQLLNSCRNELVWTLDDEIVNCLKYLQPINEQTIDIVMKHIDSTCQQKWYKSYNLQIRKKVYDLEFVFRFERSKFLFQERFEKLTFGKYDQYKLEKIGNVYCVFQKVKFCDDHSNTGFSVYPDQMINEMDDVFMQSRMRYATMCLSRATDDISDISIRRWSSEGKLTFGNNARKMSSERHDRQCLAGDSTEKSFVQHNIDLTKPLEFPRVTSIINQGTQYNINRQTRSPMLYSINQQSTSFTPRRHRSGEASSTMCAGNARSDTPMLLNDLISTATSSKGYEGDSSRVSDGEEYEINDHFSNFAADNKIDLNKNEMAPFWMLLNILDSEKKIEVYFHHTDNCWSSSPNCNFPVCDHCSSFESIFEKFSECLHQVNQCLLLEQLAQTRVCRDILVSEDPTDQKISSMSHLIDYDYDGESFEFSKKFTPGSFACPKILKIIFRLHSRLKVSTDKNTKAISLLRGCSENIAVLNRKDILIFVDDATKSIFYAIMREISGNLDQEDIERLNENSVLVTYSNNQISKNFKFEERIQSLQPENIDIMSVKSAPSFYESTVTRRSYNSVINQFRNIDLLELSVHGVDKLSEATINSIISTMGSKLDLIVLRRLSESICRSRAILLTKEDIDFLLNEDFNNKPQRAQSFSLSLPKLVMENKLAFCYYLKQNLQCGFISPKICDKILQERFNFNVDNVGEVYLYNQTSAQGISNEVIVLFTIQLLSGSTNNICIINDTQLPEFKLNDVFFENILNDNQAHEIVNLSNYHVNDCYLNFNMWIRGVVNVELIKKKIQRAVQYALTDLFMEYIVMPCPISHFEDELLEEIKSDSWQADKSTDLDNKIISFESGSKGNLNKLFVENLFKWIPDLSRNDCQFLKYRQFEMFSDFNVEFILNDIVELLSDSIHLHVFNLDNEWKSWNTKSPKSGKDYPGMKRSFVMIGRIEELWRRFITKRLVSQTEYDDSSLSGSQTSISFNNNILSNNNQANNMKELRKVRLLLKQIPFDCSLLNSPVTSSSTNLSNSNSLINGLPEFCNVKVSSSVVIPRQMLCIIKINGCQIDTIFYNMSKEISELLYNSIDSILKNHKSRFQMLNYFIYQKLGLFNENSCKSCFQIPNLNSIKLLLPISYIKPKSSNSNVGDINRERKPSGSPRSFSPSASMRSRFSSSSTNKSQSPKSKTITINVNSGRLYQDVHRMYTISEVKRLDSTNDIIYQHAIQFINTYQLEYKRRLLNKKIRHSISTIQPALGFKQLQFTEIDCRVQQLDSFSSLKRACRLFHTVVCPILFIPSVRKRFQDALENKPLDTKDSSEETFDNDDFIFEMSRLVLAHYADYVQKEHEFQFINPPRSNMSQNIFSHALFQKVSNNSGLHLIEVFILKGCLCVRLNLLEFRRLNNCVPGLTSFANFYHYQQFQKSFVKDACKFCDLTHLMSFMYDEYVRMIAKSISYTEENNKSFNPILFLRDLVKLYAQPPLYATSHLYLTPFPVANDVIKPQHLFEFLQRHYEDYKFLINTNYLNQSNTDSKTAFLYNILEERLLSPQFLNSRKSSPSSSSPLDMNINEKSICYKYLNKNNEWDLTSIFCLTPSYQSPESSLDLFIITLNRSNRFPHQRLLKIGNSCQKSTTFKASYLTILPHLNTNPANLFHVNPCPITLTHIDVHNMPESVSWKTYENRSIIPLQAPLFLTLRRFIEAYFKDTNFKFNSAITDCHKDSLWYRMYHRCDNVDVTKFSLSFEEFQDLINSGDIVDILELDNRLSDSMNIAASYLKELNDYMGVLSEDCYTVLYENTTSIYSPGNNIISTHLVLMSKKTKDGFLLLSKSQDSKSNSENYNVQLKAVFRTQDCRNRVPPQHKYFSSSLRDITVMLAETAAFCIWRKLAMKPLK